MLYDFAYVGNVFLFRGLHPRNTAALQSNQGLQEDVTTGYWIELQDASGTPLFQRLINDPTRLEVGPPPGDGGFANVTRDFCETKQFSVELPNDASGVTIVFFGSSYGTQSPAHEIGHVNLW